MKRRKRGRGIVNADRISQLPEALIIQILSLLPTEVAVTTSVLSKQWQFLWKMLPKLNFDSLDQRHEFKTFSKNVKRALLSHKAPVLHSLHLIVHLHLCNSMNTAKLIGIAFACNLLKLVLEVDGGRFSIPESLYNCETLDILELKYSILMDVPSSICLKSLRTLHLHYVDFKDNESALNLLSGCPNLETWWCIDIHSAVTVDPRAGYVINSPSLTYLKIVGQIGFCLIENVPELVEASMIVSSQIINKNLLESLTSVKRLFLEFSPLMIKFPTGSIFYQLVYLELLTHEAECLNLLTLMLNSSPKLQILKLLSPKYQSWKKDIVGKWNKPKIVPECLLFHLETFMWKGYEWKRNDETEVAKYILSNTNRLKRATFFSKPISSEERVKMVKNLNSVVRALNSCQLLIK
ncbi:putative F-box/FBD/LRR-repeat protein [Arabidopsis thaliana]